MATFSEVLGRLAFAAGALEHYRPFLGPMYAWCSSVPLGSYLELPVMIRLVLLYLRKQLRAKQYMVDCGPGEEVEEEEAFRADAKAEGEDVGIGGWESRGNTPTKDARWFYVKMNKRNAPWVFRVGEPFTKIASLELMGTLLCEVAFGSTSGAERGLVLSGTTDNKGNSHVVSRLGTTKFPLCTVLMELSARLAAKGQALRLRWAPREQNVEADELSNGDFHNFSLCNRVPVEVGCEAFPIMHEMLEAGDKLYATAEEARQRRKEEAVSQGNPPEEGRWRRRKREKRTRLRETAPW